MTEHSVPQVVGRYLTDGLIGEGAMAHVYGARDPSIGRRVAIKILKPEFRGDTEVVARFLDESRAAGMLSHPHIVTIYDVGESDGIPYIAMEHVDGEPLDAVLQREGKLSADRVITLGQQVSNALALAHRQGIIHRDIKPSNILLCDKGTTAKLLDFGIACIDDRDAERTHANTRRTQAGQVLGTPRYMSPEQAMGLPLDARTDLFSLGSVLYEALAGKPAFAGTGLATLAIQIAQQDPIDIATQVRDCPRGLAFIITKLLAKRPGNRFADADSVSDAFGREIEAAATDNEGVKRGAALRIKLPLTLAATAALSLAIGVGLVVDRQKTSLEQMAMSSGLSMTDFVARNAALSVAENAGLPAADQDWLPLQAFVETAAKDSTIQRLIIVDRDHVVRASGDAALVGSRSPLPKFAGATLEAEGFRFVRPLRYANADFGHIVMMVDRSAVDSAVQNATFLLGALSAFVIAMVAAIGYLSADQLSRPLRLLRRAMSDVSGGDVSFRLSHRRRDEIGALFDAFNRLASEIEARSAASPQENAALVLQTRIDSRPAVPKARAA